jgi:hypothetical protein
MKNSNETSSRGVSDLWVNPFISANAQSLFMNETAVHNDEAVHWRSGMNHGSVASPEV